MTTVTRALKPQPGAKSVTITSDDLAGLSIAQRRASASYTLEYHVVDVTDKITQTQAARFLAQSALGSTPSEIDAVVASGYQAWLAAQFATPRASTFWDWLHTKGYHKQSAGRHDGFDAMIWSSLITGQDQLRQRVALALLNMLVVSIENGIPGYWPPFAIAAYMDILWDGAFGNYRDVIGRVSTNAAMGCYLSALGNRRANATGSQPDENYVRELMQLFTIGPVNLNQDGTPSGGESYTMADITGLARADTGWHWDNFDQNTPDLWKRPMVQIPTDHETGAKTFLGTTIPAGTNGVDSLRLALDHLFAHRNVAPFVSKHLIQNLVTSNPSPAYVGRVAKIFADNGEGVRGDLKAVVSAILLDAEARADPAGNTAGLLREPVLRFVSWARTFGARSTSETWPIVRSEWLGQRVGHSPSVFNFFRPGYTPPNSAIAAAGLVAPVFQITDEQSVIEYINFMIVTMRGADSDFKPDYTDWLTLDTAALLARLNLTMAANQVSAATLTEFAKAVDSVKLPLDRVFAATTLMMASPEYLVLK